MIPTVQVKFAAYLKMLWSAIIVDSILEQCVIVINHQWISSLKKTKFGAI
jgi:hypothetical protein